MSHFVLRPDGPCHMTDEEYAQWRAGRVSAVVEVQNPITRSIVRLDPPFEFEDEEQLDAFMKNFGLWCQALWMIAREDPSEFKVERGWVDANPGWQLAHGKPIPKDES